jgi:tRNA-binding EMAP/Myf-like protein
MTNPKFLAAQAAKAAAKEESKGGEAKAVEKQPTPTPVVAAAEVPKEEVKQAEPKPAK